jgi:hypothetical protein
MTTKLSNQQFKVIVIEPDGTQYVYSSHKTLELAEKAMRRLYTARQVKSSFKGIKGHIGETYNIEN